jgi:hypothetical protein
MTDQSAPAVSPRVLISANTVALAIGGVVTLAALVAAAVEPLANVMAIAGPMIAGCLVVFERGEGG